MGYAITECEITFLSPPTLRRLGQADGRVAWALAKQMARVCYLPTRTYAEIADALYISPNTVKTHLRSIYRKLGAMSRSQAVERALELRLL